ncbi:hypothetical protein VST7929_02801 [Vibrio stylophorae]|uniref:DUF218 domain-containing protein n=1 Tax=Vibrio stylophorae TaxID=659351 RepID=A0ABM8ZWX0_9VIBR|nr:YdcF family protein [Vibrio stylophorae]CAH0535140.1 hypothetical protein VST7929_02801 [Vibrio stylophorae]
MNRWLRVICAVFAALFLLLGAISYMLYRDAGQGLKGNAEYAVVFGNQVYADGSLSNRLKARLDAALGLYQSGRVKQIIVSGGVGAELQDEAMVMARYLERQGVPAAMILVDRSGVNTAATARNVRQLLAKDTAIVVVTQRYHISRAKLAMRQVGFTDISGHYPDYYEWRDIYSSLRECLAWPDYWLRAPSQSTSMTSAFVPQAN